VKQHVACDWLLASIFAAECAAPGSVPTAVFGGALLSLWFALLWLCL